MYTKIIVGLDESDRAKDALALGRLTGDAAGASLTVAGVVMSDPRWGGRDPRFHDADADYVRGLEAAAASLGVHSVTVPSSSPARGLHELAERSEADLVVVGSSKHGKVGQILAGSVGLALLHGSPCSVAIAPVGFGDSAPASIAEVTLGYDGSAESDLALTEAIDLARAAEAPLQIVTVVEPPPVVYGKGAGATQVPRELMETIVRTMRQRLDEAVGKVPQDLTVEPTLLEGDPAEQLAETAVDDGGVLILGSRAYGPLRRVLLGSVSTKLVRSAPCPVIVHPRGAKAEAQEPEPA